MVLHPFPAAENTVFLPLQPLAVILNISLYLGSIAAEALQTAPLKPRSLLHSPVQYARALFTRQSSEKIQPDLQPPALLLEFSAGAQPSNQSG
ncbi:hypothetical protein D3C73_915970 [compost metagenome]